MFAFISTPQRVCLAYVAGVILVFWLRQSEQVWPGFDDPQEICTSGFHLFNVRIIRSVILARFVPMNVITLVPEIWLLYLYSSIISSYLVPVRLGVGVSKSCGRLMFNWAETIFRGDLLRLPPQHWSAIGFVRLFQLICRYLVFRTEGACVCKHLSSQLVNLGYNAAKFYFPTTLNDCSRGLAPALFLMLPIVFVVPRVFVFQPGSFRASSPSASHAFFSP